MADKQYYMSPDGTVVDEKDFKYLKAKKSAKGYEKSFKVQKAKDERTMGMENKKK